MTTLALRVKSTGGPAVVGPMLRGPLPAWVALYLNVMPFQGSSVIPIPHALGQAVAQGSLYAALVLALLANPRMVLRPNIFLGLLMGMAVLALAVSIHNDFMYGSIYRAVRLFVFVIVLWLLTPWWGRPDLPLLRAHLTCQKFILASVWVGAVLAPGQAFGAQGRLTGMIWPIPAPQVAHYVAVLTGCTVVLWFCGVIAGRRLVVTLLATSTALVATHTRTALLALVLGLAFAGASLFVGHARVRRSSVVVVLVSVTTWIVFSPLILTWLARGQSSQDIAQLTGRTKVWDAVSQRKATTLEELFGTGLGNKSFNGLPIDSNWVAAHLELGWLGIALMIAFLAVLFLTAFTLPAGPRRAIVLLLVVYCVSSSFTETSIEDASPYLLDLAVAASLLATPPGLVRHRAETARAGPSAQGRPSPAA